MSKMNRILQYFIAVIVMKNAQSKIEYTLITPVKNVEIKINSTETFLDVAPSKCIMLCKKNPDNAVANYFRITSICKCLKEGMCFETGINLLQNPKSMVLPLRDEQSFIVQTLKSCAELSKNCVGKLCIVSDKDQNTKTSPGIEPTSSISEEITTDFDESTTGQESSIQHVTSNNVENSQTVSLYYFLISKKQPFFNMLVSKDCKMASLDTNEEYQAVKYYLKDKVGQYYVAIWCKSVEKVCRHSYTDNLFNESSYWAHGYPQDESNSRVALLDASDGLLKTVDPNESHHALCMEKIKFNPV